MTAPSSNANLTGRAIDLLARCSAPAPSAYHYFRKIGGAVEPTQTRVDTVRMDTRNPMTEPSAIPTTKSKLIPLGNFLKTLTSRFRFKAQETSMKQT